MKFSNLSILMILVLTGSGSAQIVETLPLTAAVSKVPGEKPEKMFFRGSIYLSFFEMALVRNGAVLSGSYFYVKSGRANSLKLRGKMDTDGNVVLREFNRANIKTGEFTGVLGENASEYDLYFNGNWKGAGKKSRQFGSTGLIIGFTGHERQIKTDYILENRPKRSFQISASYPQIVGANAADVADFNATAKKMIVTPVAEFKRMALSLTAEERKELRGAQNDFSVFSYIKFANDGLISVQNVYSESSNGMIHPLDGIETLNYDLRNRRRLKLGDLFEPGAKYLETISAYCLAELQSRPPLNGSKLADGDWADGTKPTAENYENWNLMQKGMLISFNEYQVGPYSVGMQYVLIPYEELKNIAKPDGALANMMSEK